MSNEVTIPSEPRNGIYGGDVYKQWDKLLDEVLKFIPDHTVGAHIGGTCAKMRAKAKIIELHAKALVEICNATQPDRK